MVPPEAIKILNDNLCQGNVVQWENKELFSLVRKLKALESLRNVAAKDEIVEEIGEQWYNLNPILRGNPDDEEPEGMDPETAVIMFSRMWRVTRYAEGEGILQAALEQARVAPTPDWIEARFRRQRNPAFRLLVKWCAELAMLSPRKVFYLSQPSIAKLLKVPTTTAFQWLEQMITKETLEKVRSGNANTANRYKFIGPLEEQKLRRRKKADGAALAPPPPPPPACQVAPAPPAPPAPHCPH